MAQITLKMHILTFYSYGIVTMPNIMKASPPPRHIAVFRKIHPEKRQKKYFFHEILDNPYLHACIKTIQAFFITPDTMRKAE